MIVTLNPLTVQRILLPVCRCRLEELCISRWEVELERSDYSVKLHCVSLEQDIAANVIAVMVVVEVCHVYELLFHYCHLPCLRRYSQTALPPFL